MNHTYFIPANFTDSGRLFGMFEMRNAIEAVVLGIPMLALCLLYLPLDIGARIFVTITVTVPVAGFALIGIADDSLSRYLSARWRWRRRKAVLSFRGEVNQHEFERTYLRGRSERC